MKAPLIECRQVTMTYGRGNAAVPALCGVDLEAWAGELLLLAGPSGSGKTTLLSVLAGLLARNTGDCRVLEQDFRNMSRDAVTGFRGRTMGFVFQSFDLIPALTAVENAAAPLLVLGESWTPALARARTVLAQVGFDQRMMQALPRDLSGGQQQRVAVARALVHEPNLVLCDEPTSALDRENGLQVMELLREFARGPERLLLVVTHDSRIFPFADRIAWMEDGRIVRMEKPAPPHS